VSFVDAEAISRAWINSRTTTLVGVGKPLAKGAVLNRLEGPPPPPYVLVNNPVPATPAFGAESPDVRAPMSFQVYGPTKHAAALAASALVDEMLEHLAGVPAQVMFADESPATVLVVDEVDGPAWQPDFGAPRYVVTADWYIRVD
jgi:hypothetical protein